MNSNKATSVKLMSKGNEQRNEARYPCVGMRALYSPANESCVHDLAGQLYTAAIQDLSLSGMSFDVEYPLNIGDSLVVELETPNESSVERLMTKVCWSNQLSSGDFRVGVKIDNDEVIKQDKLTKQAYEPIGLQNMPMTINFQCPACKEQATFAFVGNQPVMSTEGIMPLYNCSKCCTTRSLPGILNFNRS